MKDAIFRFIYAAVFALSALFLLCVPIDFEYGIFELASGKNKSAELDFIKNNSSKIRIVLASENCETLEAAKEKAAKILEVERDNSEKLNAAKTLLLEHSSYILSPESAAIIESGGEEKIFSEAKSKILSPYRASIFKVSKDPFFLLEEYVKSLLEYGGGWKMSDGFLEKEEGGKFYAAAILNTLNLTDAELESKIKNLENLKNKDLEVYKSGARIHSLKASKKSKSEINFLSAISLTLVFALGYWAFGTAKIFLPMAISLCSSFVIALATLVFFFDKPHVCVLIFATSLIGLSVDYSYHYFSACKKFSPEDAFKSIEKPLNKTLATTLVCFAVLYFSSLDLLKEISVFSIAGLISSYLFVRFFYPLIVKKLKPDFKQSILKIPTPKLGRLKNIAVIALVSASLAGLIFAKFKTQATDLYVPDKDLLLQEKLVSEIFKDTEKKLAIIKGSSIDSILTCEENVGASGISRFIPSLNRQEKNKRLIESLYEKYAEKLQKSIGANKKFEMPKGQKPLKIEDLKGTLFEDAVSSMLHGENGSWTAIIPVDKNENCALETFSPPEFLNGIFDSYMKSSAALIAASFLALAAMFMLVFRRSFLKLILPVVLSAGLPIFIFWILGANVNLFHILALFILMGLGIDYSIFHYSNNSTLTKNAVFISFATSIIGFGALAFTSFKAISSIGEMLALGLGFAYFISLFLAEEK